MTGLRIAVYHHLGAGGALRAANEISARLRERHEVDTFSIDLGELEAAPLPPDRFQDQPAVVLDSSRPKTLRRLGHTPAKPFAALALLDALERRAAEAIDRGGYDVVLAHPCQTTQTPLLLERLRTPAVYFMHEPRRRSFERAYNPDNPRRTDPVSRSGRSLLEHLLRRRDLRAASAATHLLTNSFSSYESIFRAYGREAVVTHPGVDTDLFSPRPMPDDLRCVSAPHVVSVGGLEEAKGHGLVVAAAGLVAPDRRPHVRIVFEREASGQRARLERQADEAGVVLHLHRGVTDAALAGLYTDAAATVCAARLEPFGLTTLESLACGTPVVAVREGGFREVVTEGVHGLLVPRQAQAVADAISAVMMGQVARGQHLRDSVTRYWTWDACTRRVEAELVRIAQDVPAGP